MKLQEHDVVRLADGREGSIVDIQDAPHGRAYLIEVDGMEFFDWPYVGAQDIAAVIWHAADRVVRPPTKAVLSA